MPLSAPPDWPNRARPRPTRSSPMASTANASTSERELAGGVAVVGATPDPEDADRHGVDAEVLHGREVGERLHHHHRGAGRDRRVATSGSTTRRVGSAGPAPSERAAR